MNIRREVRIAAPPARVWPFVTDPARIARWLMPNDFAPVVGRAFTLDCAQQGAIHCRVLEIVPEQRIVYTFRSAATVVDTLVTITLRPDGAHTLVTLEHTGWDALPGSERHRADGFADGWRQKLVDLAAFASDPEETT